MTNLLKKLKSTSEHSRIVLKNMLGAFVVKGLALVLSLFTMPAYMDFFHDEVTLGLWFTVLSVLNWMLNFDLGIGNGLRNHLSKALACDHREDAKRYVSSAYLSIGTLCVLVLIVFLSLCHRINWNAVFNIQTNVVSQQALLLTVRIVFSGIMLQLFLKLISSVLYAMQKSSVNNFLTLCTSVITIILVNILPSGTNDENIICMAVVHAVAVAAPLMAASILVFCSKKMCSIRPGIRSFSRSHAKAVLSLGGVFFFVQLAYMFIMSTNEYLITLFAGSEYVVQYQIYYKIFSIAGTVFSLALTPVWSAVTSAIAQNKIGWVRSLYRKMLLMAFAGMMCELLIVPCLQFAVDLWLGEKAITVNGGFGLVFAMMGTLMIMNSALSSIANGLGKLKTQAVFFGIGAVLKVPLSQLFVMLSGSWIGVVAANVVCMLVYCLVQPVWLNRYFRSCGHGQPET